MYAIRSYYAGMIVSETIESSLVFAEILSIVLLEAPVHEIKLVISAICSRKKFILFIYKFQCL